MTDDHETEDKQPDEMPGVVHITNPLTFDYAKWAAERKAQGLDTVLNSGVNDSTFTVTIENKERPSFLDLARQKLQEAYPNATIDVQAAEPTDPATRIRHVTSDAPRYLKQMIDAFCAMNDSYHLAHVALDDYNLDDGTIRWLIDDAIPKARDAWLQTWAFETNEDVDSVIAFLRFLLTVPEWVRDEVEEVEDDDE